MKVPRLVMGGAEPYHRHNLFPRLRLRSIIFPVPSNLSSLQASSGLDYLVAVSYNISNYTLVCDQNVMYCMYYIPIRGSSQCTGVIMSLDFLIHVDHASHSECSLIGPCPTAWAPPFNGSDRISVFPKCFVIDMIDSLELKQT